MGTGSLCAHRLMLVLGYVLHCFVLLLWSCFKMASDRTKWSTYVDSHISGTQGVNTTPFCAAGTQALVPGNKVWTTLQFSNQRLHWKQGFDTGVLILASSQIWLWQYNIDPGEVLCPAVLVKTRVCGGCSVSRAHKTFLRSSYQVFFSLPGWIFSHIISTYWSRS